MDIADRPGKILLPVERQGISDRFIRFGAYVQAHTSSFAEKRRSDWYS